LIFVLFCFDFFFLNSWKVQSADFFFLFFRTGIRGAPSPILFFFWSFSRLSDCLFVFFFSSFSHNTKNPYRSQFTIFLPSNPRLQSIFISYLHSYNNIYIPFAIYMPENFKNQFMNFFYSVFEMDSFFFFFFFFLFLNWFFFFFFFFFSSSIYFPFLFPYSTWLTNNNNSGFHRMICSWILWIMNDFWSFLMVFNDD